MRPIARTGYNLGDAEPPFGASRRPLDSTGPTGIAGSQGEGPVPHAPTQAPRTPFGPWLLALALIAPPAQGQGPGPARPLPEGLNFANGLYRNRQYGLAAEEYERFLGAKGVAEIDAADAWFGLGNARLWLGKYQEARQAFEAFVKLAPDHPSAATGRYRVGETSYVLNDLPEARRSLEAYVAGGSGERRYLQPAWTHLGDIATRMDHLPAARRAYESALAGDPQGSLPNRARLGLGRTLSALGEPDEAVRVLKDLAAKGGAEWADKAWLLAGQAEASAGRWAGAVAASEALEAASPRSPLVPQSRIDRAEALAKLGRLDEAEALLRPIADDGSRPLAPRAADALGALLLAAKKPADALAVVEAALARPGGGSTPAAPGLRYRAAEATQALGRLDDARRRFAALAEGDPKAPWADDAQLRAAALALDAKDLDAARRLAGPFASRFPDSPLKADARLIDARAALASGRPKEAIESLDGPMAADRPRPDVAQAAAYTLALAYGKDGQPEKASAVLDRLAQGGASGGVGADARFLLGQGAFDAGRHAEAIAALEKYLADKPGGDVADAALARIALAHAALGQGDEADAALARLASGFPKSPALPSTRLNLAESALGVKQFERASGLFRQASEGLAPPLKGRALSGLGWSLLQGGKPEDAAAAFAALIEASPDDPLALDAAVGRARALAEAKQPEGAMAALASVVAKSPKAPQAGPAALALARLQVEAKQFDAAAKTYALLTVPGAPDPGERPDVVLAEWAWALGDAGQGADADATFARLLRDYPDSPKAADARLNLAESAYAARQFDRVAELLGPVVAPASAARPALIQSALYRLGRTEAERGDWAGALATFNRLLADAPDGPFRREGRFWKAEAASRSGDPKGAEADFAALIAEDPGPDDPKGLVATAKGRRVQCLVQLGRWADALTAADAFKADEPSDPLGPEVEYGRGRALQGLARFDEAREAFDRAIEGRKGSELAARSQLMRGETYFHQEDYREALREFYKVFIQYNAPEWQAVALLEAGKVHEKLGQWREAADAYEKLRARFPADRNADEAGKRLEAARRRAARPEPADAPARR